jgi:hypothetical protein
VHLFSSALHSFHVHYPVTPDDRHLLAHAMAMTSQSHSF